MPWLSANSHLRVNWAELRCIAHHYAIGTKNHDRTCALGKFWNDDSYFCVLSNSTSDQSNELFRSINTASSGMEQQFHTFTLLHVVEQVHERHSIVSVDDAFAAAAGYVANETTLCNRLNVANDFLALVALRIVCSEERCPGRRVLTHLLSEPPVAPVQD